MEHQARRVEEDARLTAPRLLPELAKDVLDPLQVDARDVEDEDHREQQREEAAMAFGPAPRALVLVVQREHRAEVAVVVDADDVRRRVMQLDVAALPVGRRQHEEERVREERERLVGGSALHERVVRRGVADRAGAHTAEARDGKGDEAKRDALRREEPDHAAGREGEMREQVRKTAQRPALEVSVRAQLLAERTRGARDIGLRHDRSR